MPRTVESRANGHSLRTLKARASYHTRLGCMLEGEASEYFASKAFNSLRGQVNLIFTSPPFPLNKKKRYGNETGDAYKLWLASFAEPMADLLTQDGSIVIELGNSWESGSPTMSTLALEALLEFKKAAKLHLCQHLVCHNPAKLPGPAEWVTIRRIRLIDNFTHVWWLAKTAFPAAENWRVLRPYSQAMLKLLKSGKYNSGERPSEHVIGEHTFLKDNGGSIAGSVINVSNTRSNDDYLKFCKENSLPIHPARMPAELPQFFIKFLTREGDIVLDPFGGSNTTGATAEKLKRRWISIEKNPQYVAGSLGRFDGARVRV